MAVQKGRLSCPLQTEADFDIHADRMADKLSSVADAADARESKLKADNNLLKRTNLRLKGQALTDGECHGDHLPAMVVLKSTMSWASPHQVVCLLQQAWLNFRLDHSRATW